MSFFNFHHHNIQEKNGIYNVDFQDVYLGNTFSIGLHPKDITKHWKDNFEIIKNNSLLPNCLAIGECGLDKRLIANLDLQTKVFREHIFWANEIQKPIIIHCVRSYSELFSLKKEAAVPMIIHGFNKNIQLASDCISKGFYLSFGKATLLTLSLQNTLKELPLDKIFLETDTSDFEIEELYQKVAQLKNISLKNLELQLLENLQTIINK